MNSAVNQWNLRVTFANNKLYTTFTNVRDKRPILQCIWSVGYDNYYNIMSIARSVLKLPSTMLIRTYMRTWLKIVYLYVFWLIVWNTIASTCILYNIVVLCNDFHLQSALLALRVQRITNPHHVDYQYIISYIQYMA